MAKITITIEDVPENTETPVRLKMESDPQIAEFKDLTLAQKYAIIMIGKAMRISDDIQNSVLNMKPVNDQIN